MIHICHHQTKFDCSVYIENYYFWQMAITNVICLSSACKQERANVTVAQFIGIIKVQTYMGYSILSRIWWQLSSITIHPICTVHTMSPISTQELSSFFAMRTIIKILQSSKNLQSFNNHEKFTITKISTQGVSSFVAMRTTIKRAQWTWPRW